MELANVVRNDYWNIELHKAMTIYTVRTTGQIDALTKELRKLGYSIVTFTETFRELERPEHFIIIEVTKK